MTDLIRTEEGKCKDCNNTYKVRVYDVLGTEQRFNCGYCASCGEARRLQQEENERQEALNKAIKIRETWREHCGIPRRYMAERFNTFDIRLGGNLKRILDVCKDYADKFPINRKPYGYRSLVLYSAGVWGVGKTHLACGIIHEVLDRWTDLETLGLCPALFIRELDMFDRLQSTFNRQSTEDEKTSQVLRQLTTVPLLVVDDVGKAEVRDPRFVQRTWYAVINGRYDNMLPVVLTANLDVAGMWAHFGGERGNEAVMDRLLEMDEGTLWSVEGESYRAWKTRRK